MINIIMVVEGEAEEGFVRDVLMPAFILDEIFITAHLTNGRGGALDFQRVRHYLRNVLRQRANTYVTTFFDLYALHKSFPGLAESHRYTDPLQRATYLENQFHTAILAAVDMRAERFIPHIQPYEFEGLLFADVETLINYEVEWGTFANTLRHARTKASSPEHINDGPTTHPSARLKILSPSYRKTSDGPRIAAAIGLNAIERECAHFAQWLQKLRALPPLA